MQVEGNHGALLGRERSERSSERDERSGLGRATVDRIDLDDARTRRYQPSEPGGSAPAHPDGLAHDDSVKPWTKAVRVTQRCPLSPGELEPDLYGVRSVTGVTTDQARKSEQAVVVVNDERRDGRVERDSLQARRSVDRHRALLNGHQPYRGTQAPEWVTPLRESSAA